MTESRGLGHSIAVLTSGRIGGAAPCHDPTGGEVSDAPRLEFAEIYQGYFAFVWRSLRRVGVPSDKLDDAVQEVFLVVHRRLEDFEPSASIKAWLFAIVQRVASQSRRTARRHPEQSLTIDLPARNSDPHEATVQAQALRLVYGALDQLDEDKRVVFVLAELEQMTAPEIAQALSIKLNTVYSRLRAARQNFEAAITANERRSTRKPPWRS